eukprot:365530-Chlamydomonas_euryale.AAC.12
MKSPVWLQERQPDIQEGQMRERRDTPITCRGARVRVCGQSCCRGADRNTKCWARTNPSLLRTSQLKPASRVRQLTAEPCRNAGFVGPPPRLQQQSSSRSRCHRTARPERRGKALN